jgi:hypothetical protein
LYAASNTFPLNATVDVTNVATGLSARVVIVNRIDDPGVFLLLSETAAGELGIAPDGSAAVRARQVQLPGLTAVEPNQDLPFHPDPDVNPAASLGDPNTPIINPDAVEEPSIAAIEPEREPQPVSDAQPQPEPEPEPEPQREPEPQPQPDRVPEPSITTVVDDDVLPEAPTPERTPRIRAPLVVELAQPPDPPQLAQAEEPVAEPVEREPVARASDPLEERLRAADRFLDDQRVASAPLDDLPAETLDVPDPVADVVGVAVLPEVDPDAVFDAEVSDDLPEIPNQVRLSIQLPEATDVTAPEVGTDTPTAPVETRPEIALPLVPLQREREAVAAVEEPEPESEPEPDTPDVATADDLRPSLVPEDAIVSLEPAEYRSPEPPEPTAEDLPRERAERDDEDVTADLAEAGLPEEERPVPAGEEAPRVTQVEERRREPTPPTAAVAEGDSGAWARANLPLVADLERDAAYVQIAAYTNPRSAKQTIDRLGDRYPIAVVPGDGGRDVYRVYVGPLSDDEKGSALFQIRNRGFRDAFLRQ